jgi:glucosamine--fructose-6-phosphate aminotransferase (isomerizing)
MAVINNGHIQRQRCTGKISELAKQLQHHPIAGSIGLGHTRWATHGEANEINAHPHMSGHNLAVVHNGIIDNNHELKTWLASLGYTFSSDTDTEAIAHLIHHYNNECPNEQLQSVLYRVSQTLKGAFALGVVHTDSPNNIYAVRKNSPLVIGLGVGEYFIASDILALVPLTQQFIYLQDGDVATISGNGVNITDTHGQPCERQINTTNLTHQAIERGQYRHFMAKEIFEQPQAARNTLDNHLAQNLPHLNHFNHQALDKIKKARAITIVACGTSYHAGLVASFWFESWLNIPCRVEIASEYRYRPIFIADNTLFITISQSGETADTLAALRKARDNGYMLTMTICNVAASSLVRESDASLLTYAGPEIGVASTKAFTTQLTVLLVLAVQISQLKPDNRLVHGTLHSIHRLPQALEQALALDEQMQQAATMFIDKNNALFIGRNQQYPLALEGALKLKEISYIHAEAYPAGELKHGALALVDRNMPVVVLAPNNGLREKIYANIKEVSARHGQILVLTEPGFFELNEPNIVDIRLPNFDQAIAPLAYTVPLQLLAYYVAVAKGTDIDKPRNLAKSVTVE